MAGFEIINYTGNASTGALTLSQTQSDEVPGTLDHLRTALSVYSSNAASFGTVLRVINPGSQSAPPARHRL